ncbi:MAG: hypothetical protein IPO38_10985 [Rhodocyclaceae bacterium]|nr:hypothetical protein [Rhodocyclaceae bacterium]
MTIQITKTYGFLLQQMAAESYFEKVDLTNDAKVTLALTTGNNRPEYTQGIPKGYVRFTDVQAAEFVSKFQIVDQLSDDPNLSTFRDNTGLSATLIRTIGTNEFTLAIRSTEFRNQSEGGDWSRDAIGGANRDISNVGFAFAQLDSLEGYFQWLKDSGKLPENAILSVTGYSLGGHLATVFTELHSEVVATTIFNGAGRGELRSNAYLKDGLVANTRTAMDIYQAVLADPDAWTNYFNLGAFQYDDPFYAFARSASSVTTFSGAATERDGSIYTNARHEWAMKVAGLITTGTLGASGSLDATANNKITDIYGHANYDDTEGVASIGIRGTTREAIFIEDQPNFAGLGGFFGLPGDFGNTHSITLIADSLALMKVFQTLDSSLTQSDIETLFARASNMRGVGAVGSGGQAEADSLEQALGSLYKVFLGHTADLRIKTEDGGFGDLGNRNKFYDAMKEITTLIGANPSGYHVVAITDPDPALAKALGSNSAESLAYRYALINGNGFAVVKDEALYSSFNTHGELDLSSANPDGQLTELYLTDRAQFLARLSYYNSGNTRYDTTAAASGQSDRDAAFNRYDNDHIVWSDYGRAEIAITIQRGASNVDPDTRYILFGSDKGEQLVGRDAVDHLYGGAGNDVLLGGGGDDYIEGNDGGDVMRGGAGMDYLEGGAGHDVLYGDAGIDTLIGGIDNDILVGGADNDILNGGMGLDSYLWNSMPGYFGTTFGASNDGTDTLIDSDKLGRILINGSGVKTLIQVSADVWKSPDGKVTLTHADTWKLTTTGEGGIDLGASFSDGDFGIYRTEMASGGTQIFGDLQPVDHDINTPELDIQYDALGNVIVSANQPAPGREDRLFGSTSADHILGGGGSDVIFGNSGHDLIEGGSGSDVVSGDSGDDTVYGDTGSSATAAALQVALERGNSAASLSTRGDWVDGQIGNDILVGSDAADLITGGQDNDLLIGGTGDDMLVGDASLVFAETDWSVTLLPSDGFIYEWRINRGSVEQTDDVGGTDMLYGGNGNDRALGGAGDDLIDGGAGDDVLFGEAGNDVILGGSGADVLAGDRSDLAAELHGADWLDGGDGMDRIYGMDGDDVLIGGKEVDKLYGGAGRDTYVINRGDGIDEIYDADTGPEASIMVFGPGVDKSSITLRKGSLLIDLGGGDAVHIENFNAADPLADPSFSSFQFADGTSLSWSELMALGFSIIGTPDDDQGFLGQLDGTGMDDRMFGLAGDDVLVGLDGNDVLNGGTGIDVMAGGLGDDVYDIRVGDALPNVTFGAGDFIIDEGGSDTLRLMQHDPAAIHFGLSADVLAEDGTLGNALMITAGNDRIMLFDPSLNNAEGVIDFVEFGNGERVAMTELPVVGRTMSTSQVGATLIGTWAADNLTVNANATGVSIDGGKGNDFINATAGSASIVGGSGDDSIYAYGSGNTLVYTVGDGADNVTLSLSSASDNVLRLHGVSEADLALSKSPVLPVGAGDTPLIINIGTNSNDSIQLFGLDHSQLLEQRPFDHISFDDGSTLSYVDLMARGVDIVGTAAGESLNGTSIDDRLSGGAGDDFLVGGAGNDIYTFNLGDGADTIIDLEGANTLRFGEGLTRAAMSVTQSIAGTETALNLDFGNGDKVSIMRREFDGVQTFRFADGTTAMTECANSMRGESMQFRMTLEKSTRQVKSASWCW